MKAIIDTTTGSWVQFQDDEVYLSELPQLFPNTSSLEGIKECSPKLNLTNLEMVDIIIMKKKDFEEMLSEVGKYVGIEPIVRNQIFD